MSKALTAALVLAASSPATPSSAIGGFGRPRMFLEGPKEGETPAGGAPPAGGGTAVAEALATLTTEVKAVVKVGTTLDERMKLLEAEGAARKAEFEAFARKATKGAGLPGYDPKSIDDPEKRFSLRRAILYRQAKGGVSQITGEDTSKFVEHTLLNEYAAHVKTQTGTVASAGGFLVGTQMMPDLIEFLAPQAVAAAAGVPFVTGATGDEIVWPKELSAITVTRDGEVAVISPTDIEFGDVTLKRKRFSALTYISLSLLRQTAGKIQTIVERSMSRAIARRIDLDYFTGAGAGNVPLGVKNTNGIGTVDFNSPAIDYLGADQNVTDKLDGLVYKLKKGDAYMGRPTFFGHPGAIEKLRSTKDSTGQPVLYRPVNQSGQDTARDGAAALLGARLWGHPIFETTQLSGSGADTDLLLVNVEDSVILLWDSIEIAGSEHFSFDTGRIAIRALGFEDSALFRGASGAKAINWST